MQEAKRPERKAKPPAKKLTKEVLRDNPFLTSLVRHRAAEIRAITKKS